jgi:hypothetical protein
MTRNLATNLAGLIALFLMIGCSRPDTVEVSGSVTWEGAPMPHGDIVFVDLDPHVPAAAGKIVEGDYAFQCKPGNKRVEVSAYRLSGKKTPAGKPIGEMYIPKKYNSESTLAAETTLDGENRFDFKLTP